MKNFYFVVVLYLVIFSVPMIVGTKTPMFRLTKNSHTQKKPKVTITPFSVDGKYNVFYYGEDVSISLRSLSLDVDIPKGATVEAWFSDLSAGNVARLAANKFMKNTDLCGELKKLKNSVRKEFKLPKKCPISAGRNFQLDQVLDESFWKSVGSYKKYVVGAFGMLELRLWDSKPCTVCWSGPKLLAGISIPFKIKESNKHIDL